MKYGLTLPFGKVSTLINEHFVCGIVHVLDLMKTQS